MQALVNKRFKNLHVSTPEDVDPEFEELAYNLRNGIGSFVKCWNTSIEVTRLSHSSYLEFSNDNPLIFYTY